MSPNFSRSEILRTQFAISELENGNISPNKIKENETNSTRFSLYLTKAKEGLSRSPDLELGPKIQSCSLY